ncbi:hypothetical protein UMC2_11381 [[Clostridium] sordellii]|uniref:toll/interleukin-1 receptor domain-containing protein n=1 Tax=Paraclostridium sordellii TaxID=1505 RepID=UPI000543F8CA|nr:toll/interleukin-1 receptor domain-containing protein [Paeniclostridium sordellii]CEK33888.1 hypothetical protein UMC2_11381 [[Clostridium] sordellii] [Paeniclostridium sordellii]
MFYFYEDGVSNTDENRIYFSEYIRDTEKGANKGIKKMKVFISHSSKDKDKINVLADSLESLGCYVFYSSDATKNSIEYGSDFYKTIRKEIRKSDVVLFMVSKNFYGSIASMIEVGIAYDLNKRMIPVGFKSGNYQEDLKGVFNTNLKLASLDNEEDVVKILEISKSTEISKIIKLKNKILESVKSIVDYEVNKVNIVNAGNDDIARIESSVTMNRLNTLQDSSKVSIPIIDELQINKRKLNRLQPSDYIFIKYIVEHRAYEFNFEENMNHWSYEFNDWAKSNCIMLDASETTFLKYLGRHKLLIQRPYHLEITEAGKREIEFIYDHEAHLIQAAAEAMGMPF